MNAQLIPSLTNTGRFISSGILAVALLLGLQVRPVLAGGQVPFRASLSTHSQITGGTQSSFFVTVSGNGEAQHMGKISSLTFGEITPTGPDTATGASTATVTAANGDTIVFENVFAGGLVGGTFFFEGSYTVLGGTGRFAGATGSGRMVGWSGPADAGEFEYIGTISSPGSAKK